MRKALLALWMLGLGVLFAPAAGAGPAPNLSKVEITHVGSENTGWIPVSRIPQTTLTGQQLYLAVQFTGYPNPNLIFIYQNGNLIPTAKVKEPFERKGLGNPYWGWVYQLAVPIEYANGTIAIKANGIRGGTYYSTVYGLKSNPESNERKKARMSEAGEPVKQTGAA